MAAERRVKRDVKCRQGPLNPGVLSLVQFVFHKAVAAPPSKKTQTISISGSSVIRYLPGRQVGSPLE